LASDGLEFAPGAGPHWIESHVRRLRGAGEVPLVEKPVFQAVIDDADEVPVQAVLDALGAIEVGLAVLIGLGCVATALLGLILWRVW